MQKFTLPLAHALKHRSGHILRYVNDQTLDRLIPYAVNLFIKHLGRTDLELISLAAHRLNQNGKMHLSPALTRNASAESVSSTRRETSRKSSRYSLSRRCRVVTNFPSFPAKGESLTEKIISTVGSEILTKATGSTQSDAQTVSPILIFSTPRNKQCHPLMRSHRERG